MNKKQATAFIILTVVLSLGLNVFFGRWITAKVSTLPLLNRWKLLSPQTPIVINNREVVRTTDGGDLSQAANVAKSKLATIITVDAKGASALSGAALDVTSDGLFVTGNPVFAATGVNYFVLLSDGRTAAISTTTADAATGLVFFKATISNVAPAALGNSSALLPGDKILFLANSEQSGVPRFLGSFVFASQSDAIGQIFDSDKPSRTFAAQPVAPLLAGASVVDIDGDVVGIWNGSAIISSDVLQQTISLYLSGNGKIIRPSFGFTYKIITPPESSVSHVPTGAQVRDVTKGKAASLAGLEPGDFVTAVDGTQISEDTTLEQILENYKPGDMVTVTIMRSSQQHTITIKAQ